MKMIDCSPSMNTVLAILPTVICQRPQEPLSSTCTVHPINKTIETIKKLSPFHNFSSYSASYAVRASSIWNGGVQACPFAFVVTKIYCFPSFSIIEAKQRPASGV